MTEFEKFYNGDFQAALETIEPEKGLFTWADTCITECSWDRKMAFLLWNALGRPDARMADLDWNDLHPRSRQKKEASAKRLSRRRDIEDLA